MQYTNQKKENLKVPKEYQKPYNEKEQIMQWTKEKGQTMIYNTLQTTKDLVSNTNSSKDRRGQTTMAKWTNNNLLNFTQKTED